MSFKCAENELFVRLFIDNNNKTVFWSDLGMNLKPDCFLFFIPQKYCWKKCFSEKSFTLANMTFF
jgi:hypothetical protein